MKKAIIVFHRIDFDGICSLAIAREQLVKEGYSVDLFPYNRNDSVSQVEELVQTVYAGTEKPYDKVVIVDIALPVDIMAALADQRRKGMIDVVWIDHHKSTILESVAEGWNDLPGIRHHGTGSFHMCGDFYVHGGIGACELTWKYFHPGHEAPLFVQLLSAYDVWNRNRFNWERETNAFQYGMRRLYPNGYEKFLEAYDDNRFGNDIVTRIEDEGYLLYSYTRDCGERGVDSYGFEVAVGDGHKGVCCLTNQFGALAFGSALKEAGATISVCVNRLERGKYNVSVFGAEGNTLDLGAYMKEHYNGGGHENAAGGTLTTDQFVRLLEECRL